MQCCAHENVEFKKNDRRRRQHAHCQISGLCDVSQLQDASVQSQPWPYENSNAIAVTLKHPMAHALILPG